MSGVQQAYARIAQKEEAARKKEEAQKERKRQREEERGPLREGPAKYTKQLKGGKQKKLEKHAALVADDEYSVEQVSKADGSVVSRIVFFSDVVAWLKKRDHYAEATFDEVRDTLGYDLERTPRLVELLRADNPKVDVLDSEGHGGRVRYAPPLGVRNMGSLRHLLERSLPGVQPVGAQSSEGVARSEIKAEDTYAEVAEDLETLVKQGIAYKMDRTDKPHDPVFFKQPAEATNTRPEEEVAGGPKASLPGLSRPPPQRLPGPYCSDALQSARLLWRNAPVPTGMELQTQLVKRGVLRQEEFKAREGRKAAARKADIEAREANKKKRAPQFRKVTNTHLGIPMS